MRSRARFDTLTAVNHPELRAGRLELVAPKFADGLAAYPRRTIFRVEHGDRPRAPGEALFSSRGGAAVAVNRAGPADAFTRDPPLGRAILELLASTRRASTSTSPAKASDPAARGLPAPVLERRAPPRVLRDTRVSSSSRRDWCPPVRSAARGEGRGAARQRGR